MVTDLQEQKLVKEYIDDIRAKEDGAVDIEKSAKMSQKEIDEEYKNLDINKYNTKPNVESNKD